MKRLLSDKRFLQLAIFSGIFALIVPDLQALLATPSMIDIIITFFSKVVIFPLFLYGFILLGKDEKDLFLFYTSYALAAWSIISAILIYALGLFQESIALDWILLLLFGLALFRIRKTRPISQITSVFIMTFSLIVLFSESAISELIGDFNWWLLLSILYILLTLTLYQYLRTMKRRRRRRRK